MPIDVNKVTNTMAELAVNVIDPAIMPIMTDMMLPEDTNSYMTKKLRANKNKIGKVNLTNQKIEMPAITGVNYGFRSISEGGITPTGSKITTDKMSVEFGHFIGGINASDREIEVAMDSRTLITSLLMEKWRGLMSTVPYYIRANIWNGQSGVQGVVATDGVSGDTLTLTATGMNISDARDITRYLEEDMIVQIMDATGTTKRGEPVKIIDVDKLGAEIILEAMPAGVAATDILVFADTTGDENDFGNGTQGIFDVIDDANTFQGIDRSAVGNRKWRANMVDNGGAAITRNVLKDFFKMCHNPAEAICSQDVLDAYFDANIKDNIRYSGISETFEDKFQFVQIGNTRMFEDEECHSDKVIVPDFANMGICDTPLDPVTNGLERIPNRLMWERLVKFRMQLVGRKASNMGILSNFS